MAEQTVVDIGELVEDWRGLPRDEQAAAFQSLDPGTAGELFLRLRSEERADIIGGLPEQEQRIWLRLLPPDDAADLIQAMPREAQEGLSALLDWRMRAQVEALLAYRADVAGGKMNPQYARVSPAITVEEGLAYMRLQPSGDVPGAYYAYVLDDDGRIEGVISYRELVLGDPGQRIRDVMSTDVVTVRDDTDQEIVAALMHEQGLLAIPVVDADMRMRGIITIDDIIDVVREEATEDIQKIGGVDALELSYFRTGPVAMIRKRAGWLSILFVGEMLTATAMGLFEAEIEEAVVLAIFVPLIISSGGNSGSQASTLVIRAMALGEVRLRDWWRVIRRELGFGLVLGLILASIGAARIFGWHVLFGSYGEDWFRIMLTVALSLVGVVAWGTLSGSLLPFILRRAGLDPASASAPFVATLVDVTGLVIYFSIARVILLGHV